MICQCKKPDQAYSNDELLAMFSGLEWIIIHLGCARLVNPDCPTGPAWPFYLRGNGPTLPLHT